jgi:hypothetical protein
MNIPLENMQSLLGCPLCPQKHQPTKVIILEEGQKRTVLHITCETCSASAIVTVSMGQFGVMSMGVLTDLEQPEAKKMFAAEAVTSDQVLEVHQFLKDFSGGVEALTKVK